MENQGLSKTSAMGNMQVSFKIGQFFFIFFRGSKIPFFSGTIGDMKTRATLLAQLRDGQDPMAWDVFFQRYWPLVYAWARYRGCSDHTAQDIVQDVMLVFFERRDLFHFQPEKGRFRDYLSTVVRNKVAEYRRRPSGRIKPGDGPVAPETAADTGPEPDAAWEAIFDKAVLLALLDVLRREVPPRDYMAFELTTLQEMPPADVAALNGMTRNAVYKARRRVMKRLKALAGDYADEGALPARIKAALDLHPAPATERAMRTRMTARIDQARKDSA